MLTSVQMDFFNINFIVATCGITAIIVTGNIIVNIRVFALGLPVLVAEVSFQMFLAGIAGSLRMKAPFRMSSVPKGEQIRSGVYVIVEDIIAVDAGQGQTFRRELQDRYLASKTVQSLCLSLDFIWGISGTIVGIGAAVALFVVPNENVAFILGE